jgi:membrane protease YdiL (CAAX protease family)
MLELLKIGAIAFIALLAAFLAIARSFGIADATRPASIVSFALILAPYWFFGFGLAGVLIRVLDRAWKRLAASALMVVPWLIFVLPRGEFQPGMFIALLAALLAIAGTLEVARRSAAPNAFDIAGLLLLAAAVELPFFREAFPGPGLSGVSKLLFVDAGLYAFLVVRPIGGIGFVLRPRLSDVGVGLREFAFFAVIALPLGLGLGFLHLRAAGFPGLQLVAAWLFTLFFVALPEEIFFRGLLLNLLERRWGTRAALLVSAVIFGLAHFPKRAVFNWRYVILAAIAGFFYGRAWLAHRRVLTSGITHATVDAVWSIWLR